MFRSFFLTIFRGSSSVLCAVTIHSSRCFAFDEFVLLRSMWPHVYVICACWVFLSVGDLQTTNREEHPTRTDDIHMRPLTA